MLYIILFVLLFLAIVAKVGGRKAYKYTYYFAVLLLIAYCGARDAFLYPDIQNYANFYYRIGVGYYDIYDNFGAGYSALNAIFRHFSLSFQTLLFAIAIIVISSYAITIKNYSPYIWLSLLLFFIINYYPSFFILRQYIAMAISLISIKFIIRKRPLQFGLCIVLAVLFHTTAIIVVPLYFLYGIKYSRRNMIWLSVLSLFFIVFFSSFGAYVSRLSEYYAHYFEVSVDSAWQRAIMKLYIFILYLFTMKKSFYEEGINRVVFYSMGLCVVICIAAVNIFGAFRLREYFSIGDFIGVPIILNAASQMKTQKKYLITFMTIIYIIALLLTFNGFVLGPNMNNSYRFFWQSTL